MRIEDDSKLDYKDVLIRPKRSTLGSRKDVELEREFTFRNFRADSETHYRGIPIMASNMDGVGTFLLADTLAGMRRTIEASEYEASRNQRGLQAPARLRCPHALHSSGSSADMRIMVRTTVLRRAPPTRSFSSS